MRQKLVLWFQSGEAGRFSPQTTFIGQRIESNSEHERC
jgi:hypothetical protein